MLFQGNLDFLDFLQKSFITTTTGEANLKCAELLLLVPGKHLYFFQKRWIECHSRSLFRSFHITIQVTNIQFELYKLKKAQMVCLGLEPRVAGWKAQTNPLSSVAPKPSSYSLFSSFQQLTVDILYPNRWPVWRPCPIGFHPRPLHLHRLRLHHLDQLSGNTPGHPCHRVTGSKWSWPMKNSGQEFMV